MNKTLPKLLSRDIGPIVFRNLFSIVAIIIGSLSIILVLLGNQRDGFFLGSIITINIIIGIIQEVRAKINLEKLQLSTKQKYNITRGDQELIVYAEDIIIDDILSLKLGDQCPVDAILTKNNNLECNLALLTGESENITMSEGDRLLSGSIVVAGSALVRASKIESKSYLFKMNSNLQKYKTSYSPIQKAILKFIKIMAAILLVLGLLLIARSILLGGSALSGFIQVAALASTIIAEGLLLSSTILFAYGAIKLSRQKVLLQQINTIENLGRMSVVCIDKTGTLTESNPTFEELVLFDKSELSFVHKILSTYSAIETSKTALLEVISSEFSKFKPFKTDSLLVFSSVRKYSAFKIHGTNNTIVIGAGDKFYKFLSKPQQEWFDEQSTRLAKSAKRTILIAQGNIDNTISLKSVKSLEILGLVVFANPLKQGVQETVDKLQKRGVQIVVISGDNAQTVAAVADMAGIKYSGRIVTGDELDKIEDSKLSELLMQKVLFARTLPAQKQKIVESIQMSGRSVAMIGDGANDAMAIKSADIGIAMFDGAPATRQIADAVLLNNSFNPIPNSIKLSDTIITTLEMIGCLFFTRVWSGIFILLITLLVQIDYPLSARNITLLNIFIITLPILLWITDPRHRDRNLDDGSFLSRTMPFSIFNAILISLFTLISIGILGLINLSTSQIPMIVFVIFFIMSIYSIGLIPKAIGAKPNTNQQRIIYLGFVLAASILVVIYLVPSLFNFFSLSYISLEGLVLALGLGCLGTALQYIFARIDFANKLWAIIKRS